MNPSYTVRVYSYGPDPQKPESVTDHILHDYPQALTLYAQAYARSRQERLMVLLLGHNAPELPPPQPWTPQTSEEGLLRSVINPQLADEQYGQVTLSFTAQARTLHNLNRLKLRVLAGVSLDSDDEHMLIGMIDALQDSAALPTALLYPGTIWNEACELETGELALQAQQLYLDITQEPAR